MESVQEATQGLDPFVQSAVADLMERHGMDGATARRVAIASYDEVD